MNAEPPKPTKVTVRYFPDCPNWRTAAALVERLGRERSDVTVTFEVIDTDTDAVELGFIGSPTILVDGSDPWAPGDAEPGLACRLYTTPDGPRGAPTWEQLVTAVERQHPRAGTDEAPGPSPR